VKAGWVGFLIFILGRCVTWPHVRRQASVSHAANFLLCCYPSSDCIVYVKFHGSVLVRFFYRRTWLFRLIFWENVWLMTFFMPLPTIRFCRSYYACMPSIFPSVCVLIPVYLSDVCKVSWYTVMVLQRTFVRSAFWDNDKFWSHKVKHDQIC